MSRAVHQAPREHLQGHPLLGPEAVGAEAAAEQGHQEGDVGSWHWATLG